MQTLIWSRSLCATFIVSARNMAIALTSSLCSGLTFGFALRLSLSAGAGWWPLPTTCWCFRVRWQAFRFAPGKASIENQACNTCVARWANCCTSWAPLLAPHTLAENRRGEQKGPRLARPNAFQLFGRGRKCLRWCPYDRCVRLFINCWMLSRNSSWRSGRAFLV